MTAMRTTRELAEESGIPLEVESVFSADQIDLTGPLERFRALVLEEANRDAERYRYLRDKQSDETGDIDGTGEGRRIHICTDMYLGLSDGEKLDAEIDAAIRALKGKP